MPPTAESGGLTLTSGLRHEIYSNQNAPQMHASIRQFDCLKSHPNAGQKTLEATV